MAGYDFFDLKDFGGSSPLVNELTAGTLFYKVCDADYFKMTVEDFALSEETSSVTAVPASCDDMDAGHGYIVDDAGECVYSFTGLVEFNGIPEDASDEDPDYIGYTLELKSDQECTSEGGNGKFNVKIEATCATEEAWTNGAEDDCSAVLQYAGPKGCKEYSFKYMKYAEAVRPYFGIILIIGGLLMVFVGA